MSKEKLLENKNKEKIKELQDIYNTFLKKLNELRSEKNEIIEEISKRLEEKNIKETLDELNNNK